MNIKQEIIPQEVRTFQTLNGEALAPPVMFTSCLQRGHLPPRQMSPALRQLTISEKNPMTSRIGFVPKWHPLSASVLVGLVILRRIWSKVFTSLCFNFWFQRLLRHLGKRWMHLDGLCLKTFCQFFSSGFYPFLASPSAQEGRP